MQDPIRLQKWLSQLGIASRREAERWIEEGRLTLNGRRVPLGTRVHPERDRVYLDGELVEGRAPPRVYWLFNKPDGVLTSRVSQNGQPSLFSLPRLASLPFRVNPVGRLDYRTEGLLILTNDGTLIARLCHPRYKVPREYLAFVSARLDRQQEAALRGGMTLEDGPVAGVEISYLHSEAIGVARGYWYRLTVHEGRNRLVRRLFEALNMSVHRLIRIRFGDLKLPEKLSPGEYRQLRSAEIRSLKAAAQMDV